MGIKVGKIRESNFELLRCLLMFMIVVQHFIGHNYLRSDHFPMVNDLNFTSSTLMMSLCVCAVNSFVLISGWYSIHFSIKKLVLFLLPVAFYVIIMSLLWYPYRGHISISPFGYWFVRSYVGLMLLAPLLNAGLRVVSKKYLRSLLFLFILLFIIPFDSISGIEGKNVMMFIVLYMTGYYLKNYHQIKLPWWGYLAGWFLCCLIIFSEAYYFLGIKGEHRLVPFYYDNFFVYLASIFLFMAFAEIKISSTLINKLASYVFFVYIISENVNVFKRPFSFYEFINVDSWGGASLYPLYILLASVIVYMCCVIIEMVRCLVFSRIEGKIGKRIDAVEKKLYSVKQYE